MGRNYTADFNDGSLTRGEALDMIGTAESAADPFDALSALAHLWMGHNEHDCTDAASYAEFLREYVSEACMDLDGDAIRADGPKDSDYTGISN